jgi:hypothetical protein
VKLKKLAVLSILALTLLFGMMKFQGSATKAAGPACAVPGDYPTIQAAVNDINCTTINVAAGAYSENILIGRTVILNGAQSGQPFATRSSGGPFESTVSGANPVGANPVITVNAADVKVDGFTFKNAVTIGASVGINVKVNGNGVGITNNIFDGITTTDTSGNGTAQAVYLETGPDNATVSDNEMKNVHSNRSAKGVLIGFNGGANPSQNALIKGNSIHDVTSDAKGAYGVSVANIVGGTPGLKVQNNAISHLIGGGWVHAIGLEGDTPSVNVTGNSISNLTSPGTDVIAVLFESNPSFSTASVNTNNFDIGSAAYGIAVNPSIAGAGAVNGTCNWWGAANGPGPVGPGTGALVSPRVTFTPWLIASAPGGSCSGPDADGDGTTDSADGCPNDPNKIAPGVCGCGVPDTDSDHDGTPDCNDACPNDPNKTAPGACGCGVPDTDTDHDGTPDCLDACPTDPNKTASGACGCGHTETPGCTTNKKDCQKFFEQREEAFEDQQKAAKKAFDSQPHTKQQKKAFEDQQEAAEKAFIKQNEIDEKQCDSLPKGGKGDKDDKKDKDDKH